MKELFHINVEEGIANKDSYNFVRNTEDIQFSVNCSPCSSILCSFVSRPQKGKGTNNWETDGTAEAVRGYDWASQRVQHCPRLVSTQHSRIHSTHRASRCL